MLQEQFGDREFTIEESERFTLVQTPFRDDGHLKRTTLKPAERAGLLAAWNRDGSKRRGGRHQAQEVRAMDEAGVLDRDAGPHVLRPW